MEEGEPWSSLPWARRRLCPFLGAGRPSCKFVFISGGVVIIRGGHRVVSSSVGLWSSVALNVLGWVVVVNGVVVNGVVINGVVVNGVVVNGVVVNGVVVNGVVVNGVVVNGVVVNGVVVRGARRMWVSCSLYGGGGRLCGVSSVGGCGCPWGGRVHLGGSGGGCLWAVVVVHV